MISDNLKESEYNSFIQAYNQRLDEKIEQSLPSIGKNKHTLVIDALHDHINLDIIMQFCDNLNNRKKDADFEFIVLIRLLYILNNKSDDIPHKIDAVNLIIKAFINFPFWPHVDKNDAHHNHDIATQVFWSENHIMMFLSTAHLFKQYLLHHPYIIETCRITEFEEKLLRIYLSAHVEFQGFHECNSHVYLPYTLSALLNLIDYSHDINIIENATILANLLTRQVLLCTSDKGVATLSASARSFPRTRQRVHGHNINQLIFLITGLSPDNNPTSALTNFTISSQWRPDIACMRAYQHDGFIKYTSSPPKSTIRDTYRHHANIYSDISYPITYDELIPFFWSAGLITDPDFAGDTLSYITSRNLTHNIQLYPLSYLPISFIEFIMSKYCHLSCGQSYTDIEMAVYKHQHGLCMSSMQMFNVSRAGFQQLPWIVNIDGVGMWSQAGQGDESLSGFALTNTHNPYIIQQHHVMVISYSAPSVTRSLTLGRFLNPSVRMFWPNLFSDEHLPSLSQADDDHVYDKDVWWVMKRGQCYAGVMCTKPTKLKTKSSNDGKISTTRDKSDEKSIYRRVCHDINHSWIVVVGTVDSYDTLQAFRSYCQRIRYDESPKPVNGILYGKRIPSDATYSIKVQVPDVYEAIEIRCTKPET